MGLAITFRQLKKLGVKGFLKQWGRGVEGITPLQQTMTTLWGFPAMLGGLAWGIVVTLMGGVYWMSLILCGSLPIMIMQLLSNWQKYKRLKLIDKQMKELNNEKEFTR